MAGRPGPFGLDVDGLLGKLAAFKFGRLANLGRLVDRAEMGLEPDSLADFDSSHLVMGEPDDADDGIA